MFGSYLLFDFSMILLIPAFLFALYAQGKVTSNFSKYSAVPARRRMTGQEAARRVLDANGLQHVQIEMVEGKLSDHYDPSSQRVRLSQDVYRGASIASVSVACHECGHAIQHSMGYGPLMLRSFLVPVTNFASSLAIPLFFLGFLFRLPGLETVGILFFSGAVLFQCVTLPVEFNASSRAIVQMENLGIIDPEEQQSARKVLGAAAMTYVAAMLVSLMQLVRLILLSRINDR